MLEIHAVCKRYKSHRGWFNPSQMKWTSALEDVGFTLQSGQVGILLGPNGAGKTTLIKIIANLILPDSGNVFFGGRNIHTESSAKFSNISFMAGEEKSFYWRLTGRQNLEFFAVLYNISVKSARERIRNLAKTFEFADLDKMYQEYSTGYRQRLAMMRSLLTESQLILMDEPTRSLDPLAAMHFRQLIRERLKASGKTVLMATHNLEETRDLGDRIFILSEGHLKASLFTEEIKSGDQMAALYQTHVSPHAL